MPQIKSIDTTTNVGSNKMVHGGLGTDLINTAFGTTASGVIYGAIYVRENSSVTFKNRLEAGERDVTAQALLAGEWLHGEFYDIDVISGSLRGYIKEYQVTP